MRGHYRGIVKEIRNFTHRLHFDYFYVSMYHYHSFSVDSLLSKHSSKTTLVVEKLLSIIAIKKKHI